MRSHVRAIPAAVLPGKTTPCLFLFTASQFLSGFMSARLPQIPELPLVVILHACFGWRSAASSCTPKRRWASGPTGKSHLAERKSCRALRSCFTAICVCFHAFEFGLFHWFRSSQIQSGSSVDNPILTDLFEFYMGLGGLIMSPCRTDLKRYAWFLEGTFPQTLRETMSREKISG